MSTTGIGGCAPVSEFDLATLAYQARIIGSSEDALDTDLEIYLRNLVGTAIKLIELNCIADIPGDLRNTAIVLILGYYWERPRVYTGSQYANVFANSGARALLSSYRKIGSVIIE